MSLKDLKIEKVYRNLSNDVINDFYIPASLLDNLCGNE